MRGRNRKIAATMTGVILAVVLLRGCVATSYSIPSSGMENSLYRGERILVNKWSYGLRLPFMGLWGYHRWAERPVHKEDILVFNNPANLLQATIDRKEVFISTIEKIQKQEARIDEFNTALSKICDGFPVFDSENQYLIALRELLKYTMQDQYDYIGWWLYEAPDAGYTIWWNDEDGKEIRVDLTEPGALYDYLVEYAAPEEVQEDEP